MEYIKDEAFSYCENLKTVDLSDCENLKVIGYNAFSHCKNLNEIILHNHNIVFRDYKEFKDIIKYVI